MFDSTCISPKPLLVQWPQRRRSTSDTLILRTKFRYLTGLYSHDKRATGKVRPDDIHFYEGERLEVMASNKRKAMRVGVIEFEPRGEPNYHTNYHSCLEMARQFWPELLTVDGSRKKRNLGSLDYYHPLRYIQPQKSADDDMTDVSQDESVSMHVIGSKYRPLEKRRNSSCASDSEVSDIMSEQSARSSSSSRSSSLSRRTFSSPPYYTLDVGRAELNYRAGSGEESRRNITPRQPFLGEAIPVLLDSPAMTSTTNMSSGADIEAESTYQSRETRKSRISSRDNEHGYPVQTSAPSHSENQVMELTMDHLEKSSTGGESSRSSTDSSPIDISTGIAEQTHRNDSLEAFIKDDVLRYDPEVADLFYEMARGILEYVDSGDIEPAEGSHELSLLRLLELEAYGMVQYNEGITVYASSTSSTSSSASHTSGQAIHNSSSSANQNSTQSSVSKNNTASSNGGPVQQTKSQRTITKTDLPHSHKARAFRCFHNALFPAFFSVNHETTTKYRACTGPGWSSMQHLREHMKLVHTKQVRKPSDLQCGVCQTQFENKEDLQYHADAVDCSPRCLECDETFESKALRLEHQRQVHIEAQADACLMELDGAKWKKINDDIKEFKTYSDSLLKKGKGTPREELENWITANTALFETGRPEKARARARIELGHWYITFKALAPGRKIMDHPFYDYAPIQHSDLAEEKILLANKFIIDSKIQAHGPPPAEIEKQREWYQDALRDALRIAAKTTRNVNYLAQETSSTAINAGQHIQGTTSRQIHEETSDLDAFTSANMFHLPTSPIMGNELSDMALTPQGYVSTANSVGQMHGGHPPLPASSSMQASTWDYPQGSIPQENGQFHMPLMDTQYMSYGDCLQRHFEGSDPEMINAAQFSSEWTSPNQQS